MSECVCERVCAEMCIYMQHICTQNICSLESRSQHLKKKKVSEENAEEVTRRFQGDVHECKGGAG